MNYIHAVIHIIFTQVFFLGLPMVGWGVGDIKGFYSQPARLGYALLIGIAAVQAAYQGLVIPEERGRAEKMLHLEFSEDWETYVRHTWRLLPYIY